MTDSPTSPSQDQGRSVLIGCIVIVMIAISWVGSTQYAQAAQNNFEAPFFVMWNQTNFKLLCIIFPLILKPCTPPPEKHVPFRLLLKWSVFFYIVWLGANYCYTRALIEISATAVSALFSTAPAWVFILSYVLLDSKLTILKSGAVVLTIAGVLLTTIHKINDAGKLTGILLSLFSAICAAVYKTMFKVVFDDIHFVHVCYFLTILALINLTFSWSIWLILKETDVEPFDYNDIPWKKLIPACFLGLSFDFFINFGIALTYPLFISLGTIIGIPVNAVVDIVVHDNVPESIDFAGFGCIIVGFTLIVWSDLRDGNPGTHRRATETKLIN